MIEFPEFEIDFEGKIISYNENSENILNDFSALRIQEPGKFLLNKINENKLIVKTFSKTYGIKFEKQDKSYKVLLISLDDMGLNFESFIDVNSLQHEIKNPLTIINGITQLLTQKSQDEYVMKCAEMILNESNRIRKLLEDINLISDLQLNKTSFKLEPFFFEITESLNILFPQIEFVWEKDPNIEEIYGDRDKLFMAFNNIIKNSCEAQKKGKIVLSYKRDPFIKFMDEKKNKLYSMVKFTIKDKASGISEDIIDKIFTPFFTTKNKGSGLGLVISKEVIESHKGRIELISEKNVGTIFNIILPYDEKS
jgi:nitrogen-specific signal transduction histidine kinase